MKRIRPLSRATAPLGLFVVGPLLAVLSGCTLFPSTQYQESLHNPFPQLQRIAVLPFFNQSDAPTLNTEKVAQAYYAELQSIPGFEVIPVGVAKAQWLAYSAQFGEPTRGPDFQRLARLMDVDAVVVGSVTDYQDYYPPRMAMTVHWYAANSGFHPIPAGYGLPWGTKAEADIPKRIVREAEFELARSQLATQTPHLPSETDSDPQVQQAQFQAANPSELLPPPPTSTSQADQSDMGPPDLSTEESLFGDEQFLAEGTDDSSTQSLPAPIVGDAMTGHPPEYGDQTPHENQLMLLPNGEWASAAANLPADFPTPTDLIPDPPSHVRPVAIPNEKPVLSQTRLYRGDDAYFTQRLMNHVETNDDARGSGWQGYLQRSDDFVRFCCHLHIAEMLESRGGSEQSDLILRWPLSRY